MGVGAHERCSMPRRVEAQHERSRLDSLLPRAGIVVEDGDRPFRLAPGVVLPRESRSRPEREGEFFPPRRQRLVPIRFLIS